MHCPLWTSHTRTWPSQPCGRDEPAVGGEGERDLFLLLVDVPEIVRGRAQRPGHRPSAIGAGVDDLTGPDHAQGGKHLRLIRPFPGQRVEQRAGGAEVAALQVDLGERVPHLPRIAGVRAGRLDLGDERFVGDGAAAPPGQSGVVDGPGVLRIGGQRLGERTVGLGLPVEVEQRHRPVVEFVGEQVGRVEAGGRG